MSKVLSSVEFDANKAIVEPITYPLWRQSDPRWSKLKLGSSNLTMGAEGCFCASLAILTKQRPDIVLSILNHSKAFTLEGGLIAVYAAKALGLTYQKTLINPKKTCIAETNFWASHKVPQHFFVLLNDGTENIIDPLTGTKGPNKYKNNIISYRLFTKVAV